VQRRFDGLLGAMIRHRDSAGDLSVSDAAAAHCASP
jgi:hypothetical protein